MKKLALVSFSLLLSASLFAGNVFDEAYWLIKDGRMTENVSIVPYQDLVDEIPNEMIDSTINGENVVVYKQLSANYLDVKLQFNSPVDLNKNYVLYMEYNVPTSHAGTSIVEGNKPLFILGLATSLDNLNDKNAPHSDAYVFIDGKWGPTDQWVETYKYIYANPSVTTLNGMVFSYAREYQDGDLTEFPSIKKLCFIPAESGIKPFYAENFDGFGLGEFYNEKNDISSAKKVFNGGINPVITANDLSYFDDEGTAALTAFRDFLPDSLKDQDGSGYIDDEILHALQMETNRDSIVFPGIQIPTGCAKIYSEMIVKKHKNEKKLWRDADFSSVENVDMPIRLKFNTGECVDLANDNITLTWTKFKGEVEVPAGATSCDLIFNSMAVGYLVDNILFTANAFNNVNDFISENNNFSIEAYVDNNGEIIVTNAELVAVYNLNGSLASENDKVVVILAKNKEGKLASKIMLRK